MGVDDEKKQIWKVETSSLEKMAQQTGRQDRLNGKEVREMKNPIVVGELCEQIKQVTERIRTTSMSIPQFVEATEPDLVDHFDDMRLTELEHLQQLTLLLTAVLTGNKTENADDGSVFAAGDLNAEKGEEDGE